MTMELQHTILVKQVSLKNNGLLPWQSQKMNLLHSFIETDVNTNIDCVGRIKQHNSTSQRSEMNEILKETKEPGIDIAGNIIRE